MRLTNGQLDILEQRIEEIQQILDEYTYIEDDVLQNLDNELNEIIFKLEKSLAIAEKEELMVSCKVTRH